jgi:adenylate kinase family enzyme
MKVEIIGPPGSGKTTLANKLIPLLKKQNITASLVNVGEDLTIQNLLSTTTLMLPIEILSKFMTMFYLNYEKNGFNYQFWKSTLRSWLKVIVRTLYSSQHKEGIKIFEPGLMMLILSGCMYRDDVVLNKKLTNAIRRLCKVDVLVLISVDAQTSFDRMSGRERGEPFRMKREPLEKKLKILNYSELYAVEILRICKKMGVVNIHVNGSRPIKDISIEIANKLKAIYEKN